MAPYQPSQHPSKVFHVPAVFDLITPMGMQGSNAAETERQVLRMWQAAKTAQPKKNEVQSSEFLILSANKKTFARDPKQRGEEGMMTGDIRY